MTAEELGAADVVIAMARRHLREAVLACPEAWPRTFTLKELVRRGEGIGPRPPDQPLAAWLDLVGLGRRTADVVGDDPVDDIEDPIGRRDDAYESTAVELTELIDRLVDLAFPPPPADVAAHAPASSSQTAIQEG